jgi:hypothetical protein
MIVQRRRIFLPVLAFALGVVATSVQARADLIIGNLPSNGGAGSLITGSSSKFLGFTVGSTNITVSSIVVSLSNALVSNASVGVGIYNSNLPANTPNLASILGFATVSVPGNSSAAEHTVLPNDGPITLAANRTYWLGLTPLGGTVNWEASSPPVTPSGPLASHFGALSRDGGVFTSSAVLNGYQLNGPTAVPEPSSLTLAGISGLVGVGYAWRRHRARPATTA